MSNIGLTAHHRAVWAPRIIVGSLLNFDFDVSEIECVLLGFVPPSLHVSEGSICRRLHIDTVVETNLSQQRVCDALMRMRGQHPDALKSLFTRSESGER